MAKKVKKVVGEVATAKLYTAEQAAKVLNISSRRVRVLCAEGRLGRRFGGKSFMITQEELDNFKQIPRAAGNPNFRKKKTPKKGPSQ